MDLGLQPYLVQMSNADCKHGYKGCRSYHWAKDLTVPTSEYSPVEGDAVVIVDVDMYMDMPRLLASDPRIFMVSTFQPTAVAHSTGDYSFTFNERDDVSYNISGGATFSHKVWNYGCDHLLTSTPADPLGLGLWWRITCYTLERRQIDAHHQIILFVPSATFVSPLFDLTRYGIGGARLERLIVHHEGFLRMDVMRKDGLHRSTGRPGSYAAATITATQDDTIASQSRIGTTSVSPHQIKTILGVDDIVAATVLSEFHRRKINTCADVVYPVASSVYRYQYDNQSYDPDAKASLIPFMSPVALGCYAPDKSLSNDEQAIVGRVESVQNQHIEITPFLLTCITEFAELLIPDDKVHRGHPVDQDYVYAKQNRPMQRRILDEAAMQVNNTPDTTIQTFQKSEAYSGIKDPRVISTMPPVTKLAYSMFTYAFADHMRLQRWYAFGKTPREIAERVAEIASKATVITNTDLSRFDGRVSNVLRSLERTIMMRFFSRKYHRELGELMLAQHSRRAKTRFGRMYLTLMIRLSGSSETADFNSADNAFIGYVAKRKTKINGEYLTAKQAWDALGIYAGDDGVTSDVDPAIYKAAAASVGQKLEVDLIQRHGYGVSFLAREYGPSVWTGAPDSMCDLPRQLTKLHTTTALPSNVLPITKLMQKLCGYYATDKNTPIIGHFCYLAKTRCADKFKLSDDPALRGVANFWADFSAEDQYPNEDYDGWMSYVLYIRYPQFDVPVFLKWVGEVLLSAQPEVDILSPPLCCPDNGPEPATLPSVVNGIPLSGTAPSGTVVESTKRTCNLFTKTGSCKYGLTCKYAHAGGSSPSPGPGSNPLGSSSPGSRTCRSVITGTPCPHGAKCRYQHGPGSTPRLVGIEPNPGPGSGGPIEQELFYSISYTMSILTHFPMSRLYRLLRQPTVAEPASTFEDINWNVARQDYLDYINNVARALPDTLHAHITAADGQMYAVGFLYNVGVPIVHASHLATVVNHLQHFGCDTLVVGYTIQARPRGLGWEANKAAHLAIAEVCAQYGPPLLVQATMDHLTVPPAPRLVCVETNPGPKVKAATNNVAKKKRRARPPRKAGQRQARSPLTSASAAYSVANKTPAAIVRTVGATATRITHRELFTNITGSALFARSNFPINPGVGRLFPWLATQARSWQKYLFRSLRFVYYTRTGTTTPGSFTMAVNRDSNDTAPEDDVEMSALSGAMEDAPWKMITMPVDLSDHSPLFVRTNAQPPSTDLKTYDLGQLFVSVINGTAVAWGRMWVEYTIDLMHPVLNEQEDHGFMASTTATGALSGINLFSGPNDDGSNGISITKGVVANTVVATGFESGISYDLNLAAYGTVITVLSLNSVSPAVTTTLVPGASVNGAGTYANLMVRFTVPNGDLAYTFTFGCTATTVTETDISFNRTG
jgi:hypothetical protein